ncbi:hypothetical protein [Aliikangiella coralliicola]|uniref:PepSY domain-containing protein n=1 Tax=Aliikangiella coralliicola TaxID=2592383 RepID=A0A545TWF9_9GAMM|nr:hypothetical protein [Aliikangiella coralliicola]TQV81553.1 hypothetical protein FLL46_25735 [Aliikangiella coralliicola]
MKKINKTLVHWHRKLVWFALATLIVWGISGVLHPIMSWTGPKAVKFFPPKIIVSAAELNKLPEVLSLLGENKISTSKVVPSQQGLLLQNSYVDAFKQSGWMNSGNTVNSKSTANSLDIIQREYYDLANGRKLANYDEKQARWLANYYTGFTDKDIDSVELIKEFSDEYPWVNRLLPVFRVSYSSEDGLVAFVHTETSALASLTNDWRTALQKVFRLLHTWNWADDLSIARAIVIALMMVTLLAMAVTGIGLVMALSWRKIPNGYRRWHRLLSYAIWLPVLGWSFSGFYHLLQNELVDRVSGMQLDKPWVLATTKNDIDVSWLDKYSQQQFNSITLIRGKENQLQFRLGLASTNASGNEMKHHQREGKNADQNISRNQRFKGIPKETGAIYIDPQNGKRLDINDQQRAEWLAAEHLKVSADKISDAQLITRFGNGYDFRNKRLPVWRLAIDDEAMTHLFIDPATGILVDKNRNLDRVESWSFSVLHKWNILNPFVGRFIRDILIVFVLITALFFAGLGISIRLSAKRT